MILKYSNIKMHEVFSIYNVLKILILSMVGFYLFGNFTPYYDGADAFLYGVTTTDLFKGHFGFTNDLLQNDGSWDFVPYQWSKTNYNSAIPIGDYGIYGFTSIFYFLGGYYGIFYMGPILTILFLIGIERIATNLFGRLVGLLTLVLLATDFIILWIGVQLRNDNIFALFFVLGCYFLIKFLHEKTNKTLLLCSIFFAAGSLIRINGIIAFPLEILLIIGYFTFHYFNETRSDLRSTKIPVLIKNIFQKIRNKNFIKKTTFVFMPWILFFVFILAINQYFYGDPLTNYFAERPITQDYESDSVLSILKFDSWRFKWINLYSLGLIPDFLNNLFIKNVFINFADNLGGNPLGIIPFLILLLTLLLSLHYKKKRIEVIVIIPFIIGIILFYSSGFLHDTNLNEEEYQPTLFSRDRYMIPALPLYLILFGFFIYLTINVFFKKILLNQGKNVRNGIQGTLSVFLAIFLVVSLYYSTPVEGALGDGIKFKNPEWFVDRFPLDSEGLSKDNSIILEGRRYAVEYDVIPFFPYWGYYDKLRYEFDTQSLPQEPIKKLKQFMNEGKEIFTFRDHRLWIVDSQYFRYLAQEHGLILKTYSKTFCKLEQIDIEKSSEEISKPDEECYLDNESYSFEVTMQIIIDEDEYVQKRFNLIPPLNNLFN